MAGLDELTGEAYGPVPVELSGDRVAEFVSVTGDDPGRWAAVVPPLFANVALFAVAPEFLSDERAVPYTRSLIHSEQSYTWLRPAFVGETVEVSGGVASVRQRGSLNLVRFDLEAGSRSGAWLTGSAQFLLSGDAAASAEEEAEPPPGERPPTDEGGATLDLPAVGGRIETVRCGASRTDLVKYAGVTRDWNPIHWDHASAVAAGLPGTIVHGLLMAAWLGRAAARYGVGEAPLESMTIRFRRPLRPGAPALVGGTVESVDEAGAALDLGLEGGGERLATAGARVTR